MHMRIPIYAALLICLIPFPEPKAQTTINPDISAIGDMRFTARSDNAARMADKNKASFTFEELEMALTGYLNPYSRADIFLSIDPGETSIDVEQATATVLRGLPLTMQFKFGKYPLDIGKINSQHPHQWAWLDFPLMHRKFIGEEGARVIGAGISFLKAVGDNALTLSLNAFGSGFFDTDSLFDSGSSSPPDYAPEKIAYSGRVSLFRNLVDYTSVETGLSYLHGYYDPQQNHEADIAVYDLKLKWRPDMYRTVSFISEAMGTSRDTTGLRGGPGGSNSAFGVFTSIDIKMRRRFDGGGYADFSQEAQDDSKSTTAFGAFFGFMPAEETTRFSIVWRREKSNLYSGSNNSVTFQVIWSLGPHKPHSF